MNYIGKVFSNFKEFYNDINPATLTGAIDVIVVQQADGSYLSSPFHVRFGKMGVLRSKEKIVDIEVNGEPINVRMKLGESGEAFFVEEVPEEEYVIPSHLATSPLLPVPSLGKEIEKLHQQQLESYNEINLDASVQTENQTEEIYNDNEPKETIELEEHKSRRKRKKRQTSRRRSRSNEQINNQIDTEQEIFQLDEELSDEGVSGVIRSSSLPLPINATLWRSNHPFSDGDLTPPIPSSPIADSRPPSPKSDSEVEMHHKHDATSQTDQVSWQWGELPKVNELDIEDREDGTSSKKGDDKKSYLGGVLNFMRYNKKIRHQGSQSDGIFLDDLNLEEMEPEQAALYFPPYKSPCGLRDEDTESGNGPSLPQSPSCHESDPEDSSTVKSPGWGYTDLAFSICGGLIDSEEQLSPERFNEFSVGFNEYSTNPGSFLNNPKLVIRMDGKFYNWQTAAPILMSMGLFNKPLPENTIAKLINAHMPKKKKNNSWWPYWGGKTENKLTNKLEDSSPPAISDLKLNDLIEEPKQSEPKDFSAANETDEEKSNPEKKEKYKKSLRMTSEQLANLNLCPGQNEVVFSVTTAYQGTARCKCHLYLWHYLDKVIISDIDGTITKSDVLGHILPIIGKDWAHSGVAKLYSMIEKNGYKFLYLSARAIGQAHTTREYLRGLKQDDLCLPDGPLLLNPTSLLSAFHREVIEKKPEEFKINCLRDIQTLYPKSIGNPFYSGFGNKINDTWAYAAVSIPVSRIFIINHRGELRLALTLTYQSSYTSLSDVVDQVFPSYQTNHNSDRANSDEFSSFTYWRIPLPKVELPQLQLK